MASVRIGTLAMISGNELAALTAVFVTLLGVRLCWRAPRYRMSMEERAKDGALSPEAARRRIQFFAWFGPAVTLVGCGSLVLLLLR